MIYAPTQTSYRTPPTPLRMAALTLFVGAAAVLQSSLLNPLDVPYVPHLTFLLAVCGAWFAGSWGGAWLGLWAGLIMASLSGMFVGSFTFSYLTVGWLVGRVREEMYGDWPAIIPLVALLSTLLVELIFFLWNPRHFMGEPLRPLWEAALNAVYAPFLYFPLIWLLRKMGRSDKYGFEQYKS